MARMYLFVITFFLLVSCKNNPVSAPDNLIDDDVMIDILYDLAIIDAAKNTSYSNGTNTFQSNDYIFKKYKIDSLQFAHSNKYYAADVPKYKRMFKIVRDKLNDKKASLETVKK